MNRQIVIAQSEPRGASQLVEIPVPSNGLGRIPLPDVQQLRSLVNLKVILKAIRLITADVLTNAPTLGGVNAPLAELKKMALVLYCEQWEKGYLIPLLTLNDMHDGNSPHTYAQTDFDNWADVDWSKSYIQLANGTVTANTPYNVLLDVQYLRLNAQGLEIKGAQ